MFLLALVFAGATAHADDTLGRTLFSERWAANDKRSTNGDGLGPMHNATSCAACHHQGGAGGGGDRQHNVELLSVVPVERARAANFAKRVTAIHPGFAAATPNGLRPNIVLHRFGPEGDYFDFRAKLRGIEEPRADTDPVQRAVTATAIAKRRRKLPPVEHLPSVDGVSFTLSQRNTPALWGAGLIDELSDRDIKNNAESQKREHPEVAGRVPRATGGGVGRFGWRGQLETLRDFVAVACANELGLQTPNHPQPINPLNGGYKLTGTDLSEGDLDAMTRFVAGLPKPIQADPPKLTSAERVRSGEAIFAKVGCSVCHPRELGKMDGLFSDMLLHDMGSALGDPVEPNPEVELVAEKFVGYSGSGTIFVEKERRDPSLPQQWRTPPLWGVASSAPYLHDGRADTLLQAIEQHGGQAAKSAASFRELPREDRNSLLIFLETLQAPRPGRK